MVLGLGRKISHSAGTSDRPSLKVLQNHGHKSHGFQITCGEMRVGIRWMENKNGGT